jgi:hypothetical protein
MAKTPTTEDAARHVLAIFDAHGFRAGEVLRLGNFMLPFNKSPWRSQDFKEGMQFAADKGWVEVLPGGTSFRLTPVGCAQAGVQEMNLASECNESITVERQDGTRIENVRSLVTANIVLIPDARVPVAPGDAILRELPSGLVERLIVTEPGFHQTVHGIAAHYQARYRREGQGAPGTAGYNIHVSGENARVNINSTDNSTNNVLKQSANLGAVADELKKLREALLPKATDAEHYTAIGAISSAETAARAGEGAKAEGALSALGSAGKWVFGVAQQIGVATVAAIIKAHLGL